MGHSCESHHVGMAVKAATLREIAKSDGLRGSTLCGFQHASPDNIKETDSSGQEAGVASCERSRGVRSVTSQQREGDRDLNQSGLRRAGTRGAGKVRS